MTCLNPIRKRLRCLQPTGGQALVETALTLPFLLLIMVGGLELGRVAYAAIEVSNAASAAVQYGAQTNGTAQDNAGITTAAQADAANLSGLVATPSLALACSDGTKPTYALGSTLQNTDCPGATIETVLTVTTQINLNTLFHFPGIPSTLTLHGRATQKVLQN
jgi:Flp pilus assembly protein TadG